MIRPNLNKKFEFLLKNPEEIDLILPNIFSLFKERSIILLTGEMGVGKTELVKRLALRMNLDYVESPSFSIHNQYSDPFEKVILDHLDLYRLESDDDLDSTGFWDLFSRDHGLIIVEWAEKLSWQDLPINWTCIRINMTLEQVNEFLFRKMEISADSEIKD